MSKYAGTAGGYPYATINAFNWFAALGGNWRDQSSALFGPITWEMLGIVHILLLTAALAVAGWFALQRGRFSPVLLAGAYLAGIFTFAHNMHERYLIPAVLLTLWAAARWNDRRLLGAAAGMTLTGFVNLCAVYVQVGTDDEWLTSASSDIIVRLLGLAETAFCLLLFLTVYDIVAHGHTLPLARPADAGETAPGRRLRQGVARAVALAPPGTAGHGCPDAGHRGGELCLSGGHDCPAESAGRHHRQPDGADSPLTATRNPPPSGSIPVSIPARR